MTWAELILILIVLFASISAIGALRRIRDASEKSVDLLEKLAGHEVNGEKAPA